MTNLSARRARVRPKPAQSFHDGSSALAKVGPEPLPQLAGLLREPAEIQYFWIRIIGLIYYLTITHC